MPDGEGKGDYGSIEIFWNDLIAFLENNKDTLICEESSPNGRASFPNIRKKLRKIAYLLLAYLDF